MHDSALANGTSASGVDMTCTNNTSTSILESGISAAANSVSGSNISATRPTLISSVGGNSLLSASHIQNVSTTSSSETIASETTCDTTVDASKSSDTATGIVESNSSLSIDQEST